MCRTPTTTRQQTSYAAYYIDVWGNKELIHRDPVMDVLCPMPVRQRPRPPVLPSQTVPELCYATCYLDDVNRDMPGVEPGTVRYLRISEQLQWFFDKHDNTGSDTLDAGHPAFAELRLLDLVADSGHRHGAGGKGWIGVFQGADGPGRLLSGAGREPDGNPADAQPRRVQAGRVPRLRRLPRDQATCAEDRLRCRKLAMGREPSLPKPPPWGDVAILDYEQLIQPIFDRHCVRCHDATEPKQNLDLTSTRDPYGFVQSYRSLFGIKKDVPTPLGEGYREAYPEIPLLEHAEDVLYESVKKGIYNPGGLLCLSNHMSGPEVTQPKQFGSHQSRLVLTLLNDEAHRKEVAMSRDEWETLVTWVDANAPYYATYYQYFDSNGKLLPTAIRVRVELDPPFKAGEKSYRIAAEVK